MRLLWQLGIFKAGPETSVPMRYMGICWTCKWPGTLEVPVSLEPVPSHFTCPACLLFHSLPLRIVQVPFPEFFSHFHYPTSSSFRTETFWKTIPFSPVGKQVTFWPVHTSAWPRKKPQASKGCPASERAALGKPAWREAQMQKLLSVLEVYAIASDKVGYLL